MSRRLSETSRLHNDRLYTENDLLQGLRQMSQFLRRRVTKIPIILIVSGGILSLMCFQNRSSTTTINYFAVEESGVVSDVLSQEIAATAQALDLDSRWMSWEMTVPAPTGAERSRWVADSVTQNEVIFRSDELVLYAAKWEWALSSQMKRYGNTNPALPGGSTKAADLDDILCLLKILLDKRRASLFSLRPTISPQEIISWYPQIGFIHPDVWKEVEDAFVETYGFSALGLDAQHTGSRLLDLHIMTVLLGLINHLSVVAGQQYASHAEMLRFLKLPPGNALANITDHTNKLVEDRCELIPTAATRAGFSIVLKYSQR
ncbi:hypothetical protein EW146_g8073 [Bondarzewia mesenterica]|uniref:DUF7582 domain-containing protein n=1 Tax=Bondarzewia mesenterica TaxID=1095465 RepID=A0A4S4LH85_9AGAM|nr:hypothetical protein EW146_g8073 [Bondarzewia mesenterica]